jgi:hypothetical protein
MYLSFPNASYQERRQVESVFSQQKRRLGSALTTRSRATQESEMVLRVLTHNLLILYSALRHLSAEPVTSQASRKSRRAADRRTPFHLTRSQMPVTGPLP